MIYPQADWLTKDEHGIQMPWYTRPFLELLDKWDLKDKRVFEYGVGYSTIWFRSRGAYCKGVDINKDWATFAGAYYTENEHDYIALDERGGKWDIVVIDGNFRDECTKYALAKLKSGGKLIIDNWLQPEVEEFWPKTEEQIKGMQIEVYKEPEHPHWKTAVITKP